MTRRRSCIGNYRIRTRDFRPAGYRFRLSNIARAVFLAGLLFCAVGAAAQSLYAPSAISPGDPLVCWLNSDRPIVEARTVLNRADGKALAAAPAFYMPSDTPGYLYGFIMAVPLDAKAGAATLTLTATLGSAAAAESAPASQPNPAAEPDQSPEATPEAFTEAPAGLSLVRSIGIQAISFAQEDIPLNSANTAIRTAPDPAKTAETQAFAKVFGIKDPTALFALESMIKPLKGSWRITSGFADQRRYLYSNGSADASIHGGLDLGGAAGTPVLACAPGRVVFAQPRIVTGNTVVLEHLPGLFSIYMHLSSIDTTEGSVLGAGDLVGKLGSTGLSTGPHLHWEMRVGLQSVNPEYWLSRPILDKEWLSGESLPPSQEGR